MKKILSLLLALILVGSMTVSASGAEFRVGVSEKVIGAGEEVTVTITLDETLAPVETAGFRNIQGQLIYDPEILNYVSHEMAEAYRHYSSKDMPARQYFTFSYTAFNEEGFTEIPAGTVVTIVYRATEEIEASHLAASLSLELKTNELGKDAVWYQNGASVVICREHTWDAGEVTKDPTCTEAGEQVFTCTYEGCGATKTEPVAALGHSYENGICTVCAAVTGVAHNTSTDTSYATVAEALDAAMEGQTIILLTDCTDGNLMVTPGVTLDLNGFDLTASYVVAFDLAQIIPFSLSILYCFIEYVFGMINILYVQEIISTLSATLHLYKIRLRSYYGYGKKDEFPGNRLDFRGIRQKESENYEQQFQQPQHPPGTSGHGAVQDAGRPGRGCIYYLLNHRFRHVTQNTYFTCVSSNLIHDRK